MTNEVKVVIGSWGSYNECNERALGSKWITLNDYDDWDEIEKELKKEGFKLDGIDEDSMFNSRLKNPHIALQKITAVKNYEGKI